MYQHHFLLVTLSSSLFLFSNAQQTITAQCSGTMDPSINTQDLFGDAQNHGPQFMRSMFCSFIKENPSGAPYQLCNDSEGTDCTRTEDKGSWSVTGTRHNSPYVQSVCSAGFSDIIFTCLQKGFSSGTYGDDGTNFKYSMEVKPNSNPNSDKPTPTCGPDYTGPPFDHSALWKLRDWMCTAAGCSGQKEDCEMLVAADAYQIHLTGNPLDQTDTAFSQPCYDATESIINECWEKGKKGGKVDASGGQKYEYEYSDAPVLQFVGQDDSTPSPQ